MRTAFGLLDDTGRHAQGLDGAQADGLRLSVPTTYGHYRQPPVLARFAQQYPRVQVELNVTNCNADLVAEGFDLAIRLGHLPDSGVVTLNCCWWPRRTTCSAAVRRRRWTTYGNRCACRL